MPVNACSTKWSYVTPANAKEWLADHYYEKVQREIRQYHVDRLAKLHHDDQLDGRAIFVVFGVLKKSRVKKLVNAYHTLLAIQQIAKPIWANVVYAECTDNEDLGNLYAIWDTQMKRTLADALQAKGIAIKGRGSYLQGFANAARIIKANFAGASLKGKDANIPGIKETADISKNWLHEMNLFANMAEEAETIRMKHWAKNGVVMALGLITLRHQTNKAKEFWTSVIAGDIVKKDDPRRRMYEFVLSLDNRRAASPMTRFRVAMTAWNTFMEGGSIPNPLQYRSARTSIKVVGTPYPLKHEPKE